MPVANNPRIFVVDDDEDDQFLVAQVLTQYTPDSSVQMLSDGGALLAALTQTEPLLDLNMPRMGGLEALKHIRQDRTYDDLPIVILTTSGSADDRRQARALRATDYLVKPGTLDDMNRLILTVQRAWL